MACMSDLFRYTGVIGRIHTEAFPEDDSFMDIAAHFAETEGTVVLASGGKSDCARYHILAVHPWMVIKSEGFRNTLSFPERGESLQVECDPLDLLREILACYDLSADGLPEPVSAGIFGYLSYDLKNFIETLPQTVIDDSGLPLVAMYAPSAILVEDRASGKRHLHIAVRKNGGTDSLHADRDAFFQKIDSPVTFDFRFSGDTEGFQSAFSRKTYAAAVEKIKDYIVSGHIYQVNLSQRFEGAFHGSSFAMFQSLFERAPAPFYAYIHAGDHRIVSTSPERFLRRSARYVETRPIKGTRPRGETRAQDQANADELLCSRKDDAELSMIVDLMRNDLGRVCACGSVRVAEHRRLESYKNVFHLVSVITGELVNGKDSIDLIRATFPGGSITGCPRIRAMEIIDELEPCRRHIYTGSIGYIGFHAALDLSIAIRTATISGGIIRYSVGGGVVFDSEGEEEYEETLHKGRSISRLFENTPLQPSPPRRMAWFNGTMVSENDVRFCATDKGVAYGYGFFETIRVQAGCPEYLNAHMERFNRSWRDLFEKAPPELTWPAIIGRVVSENGLEKGLSTVKITAACKKDENAPSPANIAVTVSPGRHRLDVLGKTGLDTAVYPHPRESPLAGHKTLNYLYYYLAGKWAKQNGADEALILNPDGSVSETNTANIVFIRGNEAVLPVSGHVLPGIMQQSVIQFLRNHGYRIACRKIMPAQVRDFEATLLTNSLMGAVSAMRIDGKALPADPGICLRINKAVLG